MEDVVMSQSLIIRPMMMLVSFLGSFLQFRNYMNDSLRTTVFCRYQPEIIACACIYLAAVHLQYPLGAYWFDIFGANEEMVHAICVAILKLYSIKNINIIGLEATVTQLKKVQIEARNAKIAQEKVEENNEVGIRARKSTEGEGVTKKKDNNDFGDNEDGKEIWNEESKEHRKRGSHRRCTNIGERQQQVTGVCRRSVTPRMDRKYRSRSPRTKERSEERRKMHKRNSNREEGATKKFYRTSTDGGTEERVRTNCSGKEDRQRRKSPASPGSPTEDKQRSRKLSNEPRNGGASSASKHNKHYQNNNSLGKMYK